MSKALDPKWVGKGDCYIANYFLQGDMQKSSDARAKGSFPLSWNTHGPRLLRSHEARDQVHAQLG